MSRPWACIALVLEEQAAVPEPHPRQPGPSADAPSLRNERPPPRQPDEQDGVRAARRRLGISRSKSRPFRGSASFGRSIWSSGGSHPSCPRRARRRRPRLEQPRYDVVVVPRHVRPVRRCAGLCLKCGRPRHGADVAGRGPVPFRRQLRETRPVAISIHFIQESDDLRVRCTKCQTAFLALGDEPGTRSSVPSAAPGTVCPNRMEARDRPNCRRASERAAADTVFVLSNGSRGRASRRHLHDCAIQPGHPARRRSRGAGLRSRHRL